MAFVSHLNRPAGGKCEECGKLLHVLQDGFGVCPDGHGKLIPCGRELVADELRKQRIKAIQRKIAEMPQVAIKRYRSGVVRYKLKDDFVTLLGRIKNGMPPTVTGEHEIFFCRINDSSWGKFRLCKATGKKAGNHERAQ